MRNITTTVYKFAELSDKAKANAIEKYRASDCMEFDSECTVDDAKTIAALFGLNIDKLYYTGFSSQGDGASFTGHYKYMAGALKAVMSYAPQDTALHAIVKQLQHIQRKRFYGLSCSIIRRGYYYHENTVYIDTLYVDGQYSYADNSEAETDLLEQLRFFANWIYKQLESEWEYQNKDETIADYLIDSEMEFTEEGSMP